jgi:hypothetical protein
MRRQVAYLDLETGEIEMLSEETFGSIDEALREVSLSSLGEELRAEGQALRAEGTLTEIVLEDLLLSY